MTFRGFNHSGRACALLLLFLAPPAWGQAPYVADVTEAREKQWRSLVAEAQTAYTGGRLSEGTEAARKALALADELFGPDDPRTLISANDLALLLEGIGNHREAEQLLRRVFDSYLRTRGEDDPNCQMALENLIDFYLARKRTDAAGPLVGYALDLFRRTTGATSERTQRMEKIAAQMSKPDPAIPVN